MWYLVVILFLSTSVKSYLNRNASLARSQLEKHHGVQYMTYTRDNSQNSVDIRDVNFDDGQINVFIIHGYWTISLDQPLNLKDDIFIHDRNVGRVVVVSWMDYSHVSDPSTVAVEYQPINYNKIASQHVPSLAQDLNEKLMYIRINGAEKIKLIGHCVGAHVAGQAGRLFKQKMRDDIDVIIGLDPAGLYFHSNLNKALQPNIAKKLMVFHTNTDTYGFGSEIGTNDTFVNGGKKQPNCKNKLTEDICSHNEAWQAYSNFMKDNDVMVDKVNEIRPFVLCLDVSESMRNNNRLKIAVDAATQLISNMVDGTFVGIVKFNHNAVIIHDVVQIKGTTDKLSLISSLPKIASGSTSIGAGLRVSMEMMKKSKLLQTQLNSDQFCSTIVLISDGEQTSGETPEEVLQEIQNSCIGVNSIGLGVDASQELEEISAETDGQVYYVMESGESSQQMVDTIRALLYSYESELDVDDRPIYLPTKQVALNTGDNVVPISMDDDIGKDTEFSVISDDIENIDMTLTSPDGQEYSSESPEFSSSLMRKFFDIGLVGPGQLNLTVTKNSKSRRSVRATSKAIIMVRTHELDTKDSAVRLDANISSRILKYPKSVTISGELRIDKFPVIHAEVVAHIKGLNQEPIRLVMNDNGAYPDNLANDGVYTASIMKLPNLERYSVLVTASSNGSAVLVQKKVDYFSRQKIDCEHFSCKTLRAFEREADVGSIKLMSKDNEGKIPPNRVVDLRAIVPRDDQKLIILEWTSPVNDVFNLKIKRYDIRALMDDQQFENAFQFNYRHLASGTLDARNSTEGKIEKIWINIPAEIWELGKQNLEPGNPLELRVALKSIGTNNIKSERSNVAVAVFKQPLRCDTVFQRTRHGILKLIFC